METMTLARAKQVVLNGDGALRMGWRATREGHLTNRMARVKPLSFNRAINRYICAYNPYHPSLLAAFRAMAESQRRHSRQPNAMPDQNSHSPWQWRRCRPREPLAAECAGRLLVAHKYSGLWHSGPKPASGPLACGEPGGDFVVLT